MFDPVMDRAFLQSGSFALWLTGTVGLVQQTAKEGQAADYQGTLSAANATTWIGNHVVPLRSGFGTVGSGYSQPAVVNIVAAPNGRILSGDTDVAYIAAGHPAKCIVHIDASYAAE